MLQFMDHLLTLLRAAAEDTRLRILALAAREDLTVSDYVHVLGQSQPRVSRHLKLLVEGGLLERFREAQFTRFRLVTSGDDAALVPVVEAMRRLMLEGTVRSTPSFAFGLTIAGDRQNVWRGRFALYGYPEVVEANYAVARAALEAAGFTLGNVTETDDPNAVPGTIVSPDGAGIAAVGSTIDVTVAAGGASGTKFVFRVSSATTFSWKKGDEVPARIHSTRAARVTVTLSRPRTTRLYTWRFHVKAGVSLVKLHMPQQIRRPGLYWFKWVGESGEDHVTKTVRVRIVFSGEKLGRLVKAPKQTVDVVLAGDDLGQDVALGLDGGNARVLAASSADALFDLAAQDGVQRVAVVDVDQYGVGVVHDLHTLFPTLGIVAVAANADERAAAVYAGANAALPSSVPDSDIARAVARLVR
jgi:DNA-binding transcriptional ArsR family regulator